MDLLPCIRYLTVSAGLLLLPSCAADAPQPVSSSPAETTPTSAPPIKSAMEIKAESERNANPTTDAIRRRVCTEVCEKTAGLNCAVTPDCLADCASESGDDPCAATMDAMMACLLAQPVSSFECGEDGMPGIKSGYCEAEQEASMKCFLETAEASATSP